MDGVICEFDFEIKHVKGKENKIVDSLSRKFHVPAVNIFKIGLKA